MTTIPPGSTIGILGGGQLGRMIAIAAAQLGYRTHIYAPEGSGPAADHHQVVGVGHDALPVRRGRASGARSGPHEIASGGRRPGITSCCAAGSVAAPGPVRRESVAAQD